MSGPRSTQDDIVFIVKEVSRVARITWHGLKTIPFLQWGTRPLPDAAEIALTAQSRAILCDGCRSPVLESHVAAF